MKAPFEAATGVRLEPQVGRRPPALCGFSGIRNVCGWLFSLRIQQTVEEAAFGIPDQ